MNLSLEKHEQMSLGQRITGVLFNGPKEAFEDVAIQPSFFYALMIILGVNLFTVIMIEPKIRQFMQLELLKSNTVVNPAALDFAVNAAVISASIVAVLYPVFLCLLIAGVFKFYNIFGGTKVDFKSLFAVSVYAYFPLLIASIILVPLILTTPADRFADVTTSLYMLFPVGSTGFLANLARSIDPFHIWFLYLASLGSAIVMKTHVKNTVIYLFSLWFIFILASSFLGANA